MAAERPNSSLMSKFRPKPALTTSRCSACAASTPVICVGLLVGLKTQQSVRSVPAIILWWGRSYSYAM